MLRLQQVFGAHAGRVREVDQDVVRFGRLPTNDFAFDPHADLDASGNHAEIRREHAQYVLVDVGSRNGTLVNGRPVQRHVLESGDEIEFGTGGPRVKVEIIGPASAPRHAQTAPATPIVPFDQAPISPQGPAAPAPHGGAGTPPWSPPGPAAGGAPKLYGQKTVDLMIQSAVAASQHGVPPPGEGPPKDTAYIRCVADDAAGKRSRPLVLVLGIVLALFGLTMCGVSGVIVLLWLRAYGGP